MNKVKVHFRIWFVVFLGLMTFEAMAQAQPRGLRVDSATHNSITLSWRGAAGIDSYRISYYELPFGVFADLGTTSQTSVTIRGLKQRTSYRIYIDYDGGFLEITARTERKPKNVKVIARPYVATCPLLPASVSVSGYEMHTHCQRVGAPGVGVPSLIAQGIVDAVDVWGKVNTNMNVCFRNHGQLKFLDAATAPRTVSDLAAAVVNGTTCATIDRAGTVVLLKSSESATDTPPQSGPAAETTVVVEQTTASAEAGSDPAPQATAVVEPARCVLTSTANLSLRTGPSVFYARMLTIPSGTRMFALGERDGWFLVDFDEQRGWISAEFVTASDACDSLETSTRTYFLQFVTEDDVVSDDEDALVQTEPTQAIETGLRALTECRLTAGDIINLRTEPGTEHSIKAEIPYLMPLVATERWGDWFLVEYQGQSGWVNSDYVIRSGACG